MSIGVLTLASFSVLLPHKPICSDADGNNTERKVDLSMIEPSGHTCTMVFAYSRGTCTAPFAPQVISASGLMVLPLSLQSTCPAEIFPVWGNRILPLELPDL